MLDRKDSLYNEMLSVLYDDEIVMHMKIPYTLNLGSGDVFLPSDLGFDQDRSEEVLNKVFVGEQYDRFLDLLRRVRDGKCSVFEGLFVADASGKLRRSSWIITKIESEFKTECYIHAVGIVIGDNPKTEIIKKFFKIRFGSLLVKELSSNRSNFEILKSLTDCYRKEDAEVEVYAYKKQGRGYELSDKSYFVEKFEEELADHNQGENIGEVKLLNVEERVYPSIYNEFVKGKSQQPFFERIDDRGELVIPIFLDEEPYCIIHITYLKGISDGDISIVIGTVEQVRIILELNQAISDLKNDAISDGITNTWTRQYFMKRILVEEANLKRYGESGAIAVIDISDFRFINEHYGHKAADAILSQVAIIIKKSVRCVDFVARYDGDIFIAFFPRTSYEDSLMIMKRIIRQVEEYDFCELKHKLFIDYGLAQYGLDGEQMTTLINKAERRMAVNKRKRKISQLEEG